MNARAIADAIFAKVEELGSSADEIADSLRAAGIKGRRKMGDSCPLYHYLHREIPAVSIVDVAGIWFGDRLDDWVVTPAAAEDFIEGFDNGEYPDLEEVPA